MKKIIVVALISLSLLVSGNIFAADTDAADGNSVPKKHSHHKKHKQHSNKNSAASTCWSCINH
jgi:hypothetical protein